MLKTVEIRSYVNILDKGRQVCLRFVLMRMSMTTGNADGLVLIYGSEEQIHDDFGVTY
jgi:hypothetical protein